jgi:16S rRNA (cytosine967-C5)-methyltransferase
LTVLNREGIAVASEPLGGLPEAVRLVGGHPFSGAAYGEGWFTAQDLGAQLVARLLFADAESGTVTLPAGPLLDACAGVGGKTTHLAALTENRRDIDAADASSRKLSLCRDHVHRLGCQRVEGREVDLLDPAAIESRLRQQYAAVLLDAPCSGVGVLRRHPESRQRISPEQVRELSAMQRQILENLAPKVMPGGILVYAVCSFLSAEGREQIAAFLQHHPEFAPLPPVATPPWQGVLGAPLGAISTLPHRHDADGFYAIRLQRRP